VQVVHGLSIPLGKLGFYLPRTLSRSMVSSSGNDSPNLVLPFTLASRVSSFTARRRSSVDQGNEVSAMAWSRDVYRIGGTVIPKRQDDPNGTLHDRREEVETDTNLSSNAARSGQVTPREVSTPQPGARTIRFPDEPPLAIPVSGGQAASPASAAAPTAPTTPAVLAKGAMTNGDGRGYDYCCVQA
jgi:hypothetical protein